MQARCIRPPTFVTTQGIKEILLSSHSQWTICCIISHSLPQDIYVKCIDFSISCHLILQHEMLQNEHFDHSAYSIPPSNFVTLMVIFIPYISIYQTFRSSLWHKRGTPYVETTSICPSVTYLQQLQHFLDFHAFNRGVFYTDFSSRYKFCENWLSNNHTW